MSNDRVDVVVVTRDLMDRSKIAAALPGATVVSRLGAARDREPTPALAVVDLTLVDDASELTGLAGHVIAFGSHVDEEVLAAATAAGAEALPRSVFFRRLAEGQIGAQDGR